MDAGTTLPLSPHTQMNNIHIIQLNSLIDLQFRSGSLSNQA